MFTYDIGRSDPLPALRIRTVGRAAPPSPDSIPVHTGNGTLDCLPRPSRPSGSFAAGSRMRADRMPRMTNTRPSLCRGRSGALPPGTFPCRATPHRRRGHGVPLTGHQRHAGIRLGAGEQSADVVRKEGDSRLPGAPGPGWGVPESCPDGTWSICYAHGLVAYYQETVNSLSTSSHFPLEYTIVESSPPVILLGRFVFCNQASASFFMSKYFARTSLYFSPVSSSVHV